MQAIVDFLSRFWAESSLYWWLCAVILGASVEFLFGSKTDPVVTRLFNLRYAALYLMTGFFLGPPVMSFTNWIAQKVGVGLINLDVFSHDQVLPQIGAAIVLILVQDFFYYWTHRAQHSWNWLWHQHALHHSDESVNATTSIRHHWLETFVQAFLVSLPLTVFVKLSPVTLSWFVSVVVAWTFIIHLNVRWGLGRFAWLVVTPQLHRIHHSSLESHWDKNFAAYFPIWDVVFGTYYAPKRDEYPPTGLADGERIAGFREAAVYPFKKWRHMLTARSNAEIRSADRQRPVNRLRN